MKLAAFNALTVADTTSDVQAIPVGTYFLYGSTYRGSAVAGSEAGQKGNTPLRHRITYHQRITSDGSLAGLHSLIYRRIFDILESDDTADQTKTTTRPGLTRLPTRDDDDRKNYKESDYS